MENVEKEKEKMIKELNFIKDNIDNTIKNVKESKTSEELMTALIQSKIFLDNRIERKNEKN